MIKIFNPATGSAIGEVKEDSLESIVQKTVFADLALRNWSQESHLDRIHVFKNLAQIMLTNIDELARQQTLETGLPLEISKCEIQSAIDKITQITQNSNQPIPNLGVGLFIMPACHPYWLFAHAIVPGLISGHSLLYNSPAQSSLSALTFAGLLKEAGVPDAVFVPILGQDNCFKNIAAQKVDYIISLQRGLELPLTPERPHFEIQTQSEYGALPTTPASQIVDQITLWSGQSPWAAQKIHTATEDQNSLIQLIQTELDLRKSGNPLDAKTQIGPLPDSSFKKWSSEEYIFSSLPQPEHIQVIQTTHSPLPDTLFLKNLKTKKKLPLESLFHERL